MEQGWNRDGTGTEPGRHRDETGTEPGRNRYGAETEPERNGIGTESERNGDGTELSQAMQGPTQDERNHCETGKYPGRNGVVTGS